MKKNEIPVPNKIIQNKDLSFTEKVIYALGLKFFLFSGNIHSKKISAFKKYLIKDLSFNKGTINKYVDLLAEKGYIEDGRILLFVKKEVYTFNNQDSGIFSVKSDIKYIGGFTEIPLKVLISKDLGWKDKAVYMALKRSWEKSSKDTYYCLNTIERFEEYNLTRTEKNIKNLKDLDFIEYAKEKTGNKVNDQKIKTFIFNGFENDSEEEVVEDKKVNEPQVEMCSELKELINNEPETILLEGCNKERKIDILFHRALSKINSKSKRIRYSIMYRCYKNNEKYVGE